MSRTIAAVAAALLGLTGCGNIDGLAAAGAARQTGTFQEFDRNRNGLVDATEFSLGVNDLDVFGGLDLNRDNLVETSEFDSALGTFLTYDANRDGQITRGELLAALFLRFDGNRNQLIDQAEFSAAESLL